MSDQFVINPDTKKRIKVGGPKYQELVAAGRIAPVTPITTAAAKTSTAKTSAVKSIAKTSAAKTSTAKASAAKSIAKPAAKTAGRKNVGGKITGSRPDSLTIVEQKTRNHLPIERHYFLNYENGVAFLLQQIVASGVENAAELYDDALQADPDQTPLLQLYVGDKIWSISKSRFDDYSDEAIPKPFDIPSRPSSRASSPSSTAKKISPLKSGEQKIEASKPPSPIRATSATPSSPREVYAPASPSRSRSSSVASLLPSRTPKEYLFDLIDKYGVKDLTGADREDIEIETSSPPLNLDDVAMIRKLILAQDKDQVEKILEKADALYDAIKGRSTVVYALRNNPNVVGGAVFTGDTEEVGPNNIVDVIPYVRSLMTAEELLEIPRFPSEEELLKGWTINQSRPNIAIGYGFALAALAGGKRDMDELVALVRKTDPTLLLELGVFDNA